MPTYPFVASMAARSAFGSVPAFFMALATIVRNGTGHHLSVAFKENDVCVTDPAVYQAFFDQLSKALFVEARES